MTDVKIPMSCAPLKPILEKEGNLNYNGSTFSLQYLSLFETNLVKRQWSCRLNHT